MKSGGDGVRGTEREGNTSCKAEPVLGEDVELNVEDEDEDEDEDDDEDDDEAVDGVLSLDARVDAEDLVESVE